ncbi:response regulator [Pantanalinema sp. GBBB05]|uniref:response regulator n=1 Tax=Pantanalinema sp. GBBB05 TaxID=2604139 RepID=UPI001D47B9AF|nr:response regulator [Pantanalinema sp. GBBB05]
MSSKLILLIDQDEGTREVLHICLQRLAGWHVVSIDGYPFELKALLVGQPDVILLNALMPKFDGLGFIQKFIVKKLKEHPLTHSIPILLITDQANWFTSEQLRSLGIEGAIAKPFNPITLPTQIAHILNWQPEPRS